jgi:predicted site-specific integrase-resolvase
MESLPLRVVGYARVSTDEQAREGVSLESQKLRIAAYATAMRHELVDIFVDDLSGRIAPLRRKGFAQAHALLDSGHADGVIALCLDRLSRKTRDVLDLVDLFEQRRWRLFSVQESIDSQTPSGRLVLTILAALAQMEREQIGQRVREAMRYLLSVNRQRSRMIPWGWRLDGFPELTAVPKRSGRDPGIDGAMKRPLVEHPGEAAIVQEILCLHALGCGYKKIARRLGVNHRTGRPWIFGNVQRIMTTLRRRHRERSLALGA